MTNKIHQSLRLIFNKPLNLIFNLYQQFQKLWRQRIWVLTFMIFLLQDLTFSDFYKLSDFVLNIILNFFCFFQLLNSIYIQRRFCFLFIKVKDGIFKL